MHEVLAEIGLCGIVPVIKMQSVEQALPLADALSSGGLPVAEITFRTSCAEKAIEKLSYERPDMLVGAGTVLTPEQVDRAIGAGARFIVSPGLNPKVVERCIAKGIPIVPGCASPSDIEIAIEYGLEVVKIFPAEPLGGVAFLKAVSGPYPSMKFIPTGGVSPKNMNDYLSFSKVLACGGSWMVPSELMDTGEYDGIRCLTEEAVKQMLGFSLRHIGLNQPDEVQARGVAERYAALLGMPLKEGNSSVFAGTLIEVMKQPYLGAHGHIAIGTKNVARAVRYFNRRGVAIQKDTAKYDASGSMKAVYLEGEIGGFALHLMEG